MLVSFLGNEEAANVPQAASSDLPSDRHHRHAQADQRTGGDRAGTPSGRALQRELFRVPGQDPKGDENPVLGPYRVLPVDQTPGSRHLSVDQEKVRAHET